MSEGQLNEIGNVFGWIAAVLGMIVYMPQLYTVLTKKTTEGISKRSTLIYAFGVVMWIISSAGMKDPNLQGWMANVIITALMVPLIMKLFFNKDYLARTYARWQYDGNLKTKSALYFARRNRPIWYGVVILLAFIGVWTMTMLWVSKGAKFTIGITPNIVVTTLAGLATSLGFIPQMILIVKKKNVSGINPYFSIIYGFMSSLWTIFWIMRVVTPSDSADNVSEWIGMFLSAMGLAAQSVILSMYFIYRHKKRPGALLSDPRYIEPKANSDRHKYEHL